MAMNKAEKARLEEMERELAFRWPTAAEPAPMTRDEIKDRLEPVTPKDRSVFKVRNVAKGWVFNSYGARIDKAWSDGMSHGRGNHDGDGASQNMGRLYRTKQEAALAMRWEMCREMARKLWEVDKIINEYTRLTTDERIG